MYFISIYLPYVYKFIFCVKIGNNNNKINNKIINNKINNNNNKIIILIEW